jgi:hypothetical protein
MRTAINVSSWPRAVVKTRSDLVVMPWGARIFASIRSPCAPYASKVMVWIYRAECGGTSRSNLSATVVFIDHLIRRSRRDTAPLSDRALVLVANRLTAPGSELGLARWLETEFVWIDGRRWVSAWRDDRERASTRRPGAGQDGSAQAEVSHARPVTGAPIAHVLYLTLRDLFSSQQAHPRRFVENRVARQQHFATDTQRYGKFSHTLRRSSGKTCWAIYGRPSGARSTCR